MGRSPGTEEIKEYSSFLNSLADAAAQTTLPMFKKPLEVTNKGRKLDLDYDPVTQADRQAEDSIPRLIKNRYPDHNILGEEHGAEQNSSSDKDRQYTWVIDPIDGTRAYICGIPTWGTLIALNDGERPFIGMLDQPYLKERYMGSAKGAYLNNNIIYSRACTEISKATVSTTDPTQFFATSEDANAFFRVADKAQLVRNGYDCYAYVMVAAGFMDVVIESGLEPYDIQALIPIVEGSGGVITGWDGGTASNGGQVVASATAKLHEQVLDLLNS